MSLDLQYNRRIDLPKPESNRARVTIYGSVFSTDLCIRTSLSYSKQLRRVVGARLNVTATDREALLSPIIRSVGRIVIILIAVFMSTICVSPRIDAEPAKPTLGKGYDNGIRIGTKITMPNWRQYEQFMDPGMVELFKGSSFWHLPLDVELDVGPTWPEPEPRPFRDDTDRYSRLVTLRTPFTGEHYPQGYIAGEPFPHPEQGDQETAGAKVFWDATYRARARLDRAMVCTYTGDAQGNFTETGEVNAVASKLAFNSDPPYPRNLTGNTGFFFTYYLEQVAPEQNKYFTALILYPQDPTRLPEEYQYLPTLRRSIQVSQAARCAQQMGTDLVADDINFGLPPNGNLFTIDYLGVVKTLVLMHAAAGAYKHCGNYTERDPAYVYEGKGIAIFPRPTMGEWEVRSQYVIEMKLRNASKTGYCYGRRRLYIDRENFFVSKVDLWSPSGELFKWIFTPVRPIDQRAGVDGQILSSTGFTENMIVDFVNRHVSDMVGLEPCVDGDCDPAYLDITRYALPEGLMRIGQ